MRTHEPLFAGFYHSGEPCFVTFDELIAEDFFQPRITSVVQPTFDIGHKAVEVLFERFDRGSAASISRVRLPATLVVRDSSRRQMDSICDEPRKRTIGR